MVADLIRGKAVVSAEAQLKFSGKRAGGSLLKLLKSAVRNAEYNFNLKKGDLYIAGITVDGGPVFKRYRPRAFGRASMLRKKTSHINLILGVKEGVGEVKKVVHRRPESDKRVFEEPAALLESRQSDKTQEQGVFKRLSRETLKTGSRVGKKSSDFVKKVFRRKVI